MKYLFVLFGCCLMQSAAAHPSGTGDSKKPVKDSSAQQEKLEALGFKNLFGSDSFSTTHSYEAQINPNAIPYIRDYIAKHGKGLEDMKTWGQPYFRMMDGILMSYGLPKELKYLAVIESRLQSLATSWAGAVGPWQFMPETGRRMGLMINSRYDERTNYVKSTHAAARYLKELYDQLGDWLLVIAAYNGGPGRVKSAIRKSGSVSFWSLQNFLPEESRNHVKKFIGTHFLMEGAGGLTTTTKAEWGILQAATLEQTTQLQTALTATQLEGVETLNISGKYNAVVLANSLSMDILQFNRLNPNFDKMVSTEKGYDLRLPAEKLALFNANRYIILNQSILYTLRQAGNMGAGFPGPSR